MSSLFHNAEPEPGAEAISSRIHEGELLVFRGLAPLARITERARALLAFHLGAGDEAAGRDPPRAERVLTPEAFRAALAKARREIASDATIWSCWCEVLAQLGFAGGLTLSDRVRLRAVPSQRSHTGRIYRPLPAHRDSWGSGLPAQINWWTPLYPLARRRTMRLWPDWFRKPIANDSATWDYDLLTGPASKRRPDYPLLPSAARPCLDGSVPVMIEPGALLGFSAAHLHQSIRDGSRITRFCLDTRSLWRHDCENGRGAPNVDGATRRPLWELFTPLEQEGQQTREQGKS